MNKDNHSQICKEYLYGLQWIWSYYTGKLDDICFNWFYKYSFPPLWQWLHTYLQKELLPEFPKHVYYRAQDILPIEQLALVLPLKSWKLIPPCPQRNLPHWAPYLFPTCFSFEVIGKQFEWEKEANIPFPTIVELKEIVKYYTSSS
jgi:5'-3' exonuclease